MKDEHSSFTEWTTKVSNPVRSSCFRTSASVGTQRDAFAFGSIPPLFGDFHFQPDSPPMRPLRIVILKNTCPLDLIAAAGTELAEASSSSFRLLSKIPHCHPSRLSRPCLIPSMADNLKRPAKHHWIGASFPSAQLPENNVRLACVKHIASVTSEPGLNSSFDYDLSLQCLVIDILEKLVKSRQTLSKAMVARNGFSQVIDPPYG
ncbi:hypothetical protein Tco_1578656 [Tanacetum coccineum]